MDRSPTKEAIANGYHILLEKGSDDITVTALIKECGVSRQTFYYHFKGLDDLRDYMMQCNLEDVKAKYFNKSGEGYDLKGIVEDQIQRMRFMKVIEEGPNKEGYRSRYTSIVSDFVKEYVKTHPSAFSQLTTDQLDCIVAFYAYGFVGLFTSAAREGKEMDADMLTDLLTRTCRGELPISPRK